MRRDKFPPDKPSIIRLMLRFVSSNAEFHHISALINYCSSITYQSSPASWHLKTMEQQKTSVSTMVFTSLLKSR